jgi:glyoxylase-like metal-dependent hydrolase (beta-lactamase superfamily II)
MSGGDMRIDRVVVGHLSANCWVVSNRSGDVAIIDPGDDTDAICAQIDALGFEDPHVGAVILTHGHFDHVGSADEVADDCGAFIYISAPEAKFIAGEIGTGGFEFGLDTQAPLVDFKVDDGDEIEVGALKFKVILTPGHSPGSMCLLIHDDELDVDHLFSGDTVFAGSIGRTDFDGGDENAMTASLEKLSAALADSTLIYPGHGTTSTVLDEQGTNSFWPS